jgi:hypothetical protein
VKGLLRLFRAGEAVAQTPFSCSMSANQRIGPALRPGLFLGPDAVLVAGSGLIIRLRKDIVGSTPTRPTKDVKEGFRDFGALFYRMKPAIKRGNMPLLLRC